MTNITTKIRLIANSLAFLLFEMLHVDVAIPDLTITLELQGEDSLSRAVLGVVVDRDGDQVTVDDVGQRISTSDDFKLIPLSVETLVRFHELCRIIHDGGDSRIRTARQQFGDSAWKIHDAAALPF